MDYTNLSISKENKDEEDSILQKVSECIDNYDSFIYETGAGAGKTYALKEALIYAVKKYGREFENNDQNILCITFTNVAANEIKERLGKTQLVLVSTIHERIWEIICKYQKQLIEIHKAKIIEEIQNIDHFFENNNDADWYYSKPNDEKEKINDTLLINKKEYNQKYNLSAKEFNEEFIDKYFPGIGVKKTKFRNTADKIYRYIRFKAALEDIDNKTEVKYNPKYNNDRLDKFYISHDTLLEYAVKMIENVQLQRILIDKFPIILIDEFQDTSESVVNFINKLHKEAKNLNKRFCVGFFGDLKQNIYDKGIGNNFNKINEEYTIVANPFNRRSKQNIIDIANKIRNDEIKQKSIYTNFNDASIKLVNDDFNDVNASALKSEWNISKDNQLHCLTLKNETVAKMNQFSLLFDTFKHYYKGARYNQLNSELLSNDETKLGNVQLLIKRIMEFKLSIKDSNTLINNLVDLQGSNNIYKLSTLKQLIDDLKKVDGKTLEEFMESLFNVTSIKSNEIKYLLKADVSDMQSLEKYIITYLNVDDENSNIDDIMNLPMKELENWYRYIILDFEDKDIIYQTIHSTKGLEYDNVIIELDDEFAHDKQYFSRLFKNLDNDANLENAESKKLSSARNLLYVAVTRAVSNLAIYYKNNQEVLNCLTCTL